MDDCKKITATAKELVVNVRDGSKVVNSTLKEISAKLKTVSVTPKDPLKCVRVDLKGLGEEHIPELTLFKYNEDKSVVNDSLLKEFGRGVADSATYTDNLFLNVGKNFVDTTVGTDVLTSLMNWVRNVHDNYVEYQFKYIDILTVGLSKVLIEQGIAADILAKVLSKVFAETAIASDTVSKTLQPSKIETATATDILTVVVDFNLTLQDWAYLTDDVLANVEGNQDKAILELMTYTDVLSTNLAKVFAETAIGSDTLAVTSGKVAIETAIAADGIISLVNKGVVETAISSDILAASSSKVLSEIAIGTDSLGITTNKVLADSVAMSDAFGIVGWYGDSSIFTDVFSKSLSIVLVESSPISETVSKSVSTSKTELAVMFEVRTANLQNYMVPLYVDAGYIGTNYSI